MQFFSSQYKMPEMLFHVSLLSFDCLFIYTLPKTNIAPETLGVEDEFPFGKVSWQVRTVSFRKGNCILYIPDAPCMEYLPTFGMNLW